MYVCTATITIHYTFIIHHTKYTPFERYIIIYIYAYIHTHTYRLIHVCQHIYRQILMYTFMYIWLYTYMHTYVYTWMSPYIHIYLQIHMYTLMHVWLYTYINTYVWICLPAYTLTCIIYMCMHMSHRGGLWQYFYNVHALGTIYQQQSWFGAIG